MSKQGRRKKLDAEERASKARERMRKMMGPAADLLGKEVQYANGVLDSLREPTGGARGYSLSVLYHTHIEALDAVDLLLSGGAGTSSLVQVRTLLEATAQLAYVANSEGHRLGMTYMLSTVRAQSLEVGLFDDDLMAGLFSRSDEEAEIFASVSRLKPYEPWYRSDGGPRSIKKLIEHTGLGMFYQDYSRLSRSVHASASGEALNIDPAVVLGFVPSTVAGYLRPLRSTRKGVWQRALRLADHLFWIGTRLFLREVAPTRLAQLQGFQERVRAPCLQAVQFPTEPPPDPVPSGPE